MERNALHLLSSVNSIKLKGYRSFKNRRCFMKNWNMWSNEVAKERSMLTDYGYPRKGHSQLPTIPDTFKAQALRELAKRLVLEDLLQEAKKEIDTLNYKIGLLTQA